MSVKVERLDHHGRGIVRDGGKITFITDALPGEEVEIEVYRETSKYKEAFVKEYITKSEERVSSKCPFYSACGGCQLRHMSYDDTLEFKENKLKDIFAKYAGLEPKIEIVKDTPKNFYRNKLEVRFQDGKMGIYKTRSHEIVDVDRCLNAEDAINAFLLNANLLNIKDGSLVIKSNYNGELILVVNTPIEPDFDVEPIREKHKLVGIVWNEKVIFGTDHFIEVIDDLLFKESFNSFFQVNRLVNKKLFGIIRENISNDETVLDMCSGVGTLSIAASTKAKKVYGIEIVPNAARDALINARMNKRENVNFLLGDAFTLIEKINDKIDTVIIDPPRSGLNKSALTSLLKRVPQKIIYVSCDPITLSRDLKVLKTKYDMDYFLWYSFE